jgi:hypothetical protein
MEARISISGSISGRWSGMFKANLQYCIPTPMPTAFTEGAYHARRGTFHLNKPAILDEGRSPIPLSDRLVQSRRIPPQNVFWKSHSRANTPAQK